MTTHCPKCGNAKLNVETVSSEEKGEMCGSMEFTGVRTYTEVTICEKCEKCGHSNTYIERLNEKEDYRMF